jgi:hypothetical protein
MIGDPWRTGDKEAGEPMGELRAARVSEAVCPRAFGLREGSIENISIHAIIVGRELGRCKREHLIGDLNYSQG